MNPDRETPFLSFVRLYSQIDYYCKSFTFLLLFYFIYYCILSLYRLHCCLAIWMWFWSSETCFLNLCVFPLPSALSPARFLQPRVCVCVCVFSCIQLFATPWTVAHQAPLVSGIFQARKLERVAISSSRGSAWFRDQAHISCISCIAGRFCTTEPP